MSSASQESASDSALEAEEVARANLYGVISRLFYGPPDPNLLAEICGGQAAEGGGEGGGLVAAWHALQEAGRSAYPAVLKQEYDSLFVGAGKAQVTPYLSGYTEPAAPDRYLVRLRERLAGLGLARRAGVFEVEDHISGISDVMRWHIEARRPFQEQQEFFEEFAFRGAILFCAAVQKAPSASFYRQVAAFASEFLELERAAFEIGSTA